MTADLNWQEKLYIVDVEVEYLNGKPKLYKIIDVDFNETFMEEDDEIELAY